MDDVTYLGEEFKQQLVESGRQARLDTLAAGVPVFYKDPELKVDVMEMPDGRKFQIEYISGAPRQSNHRIIRELVPVAR